MLYKKYQLYDDGLEIMIPSELNMDQGFLATRYTWISDDRQVVINVSRGGRDLSEEDLLVRMDEYYRGFKKDITDFECLSVKKKWIGTHFYGEMSYSSYMTGYKFYNIFLLGSYMDREIIISHQCTEAKQKVMMHVFDNITDSIRVIKKNERR